jgi:hypothetical protein
MELIRELDDHCCPGKSIYNIFTGQPIEDLSFRKKLNLKFYWFLSDCGNISV